MTKSVFVILAFHAQEPLWDLPQRVIETLRDDDVRREAVGNDNWVQKRADAGRDIYANLLEFGANLGAPLSLEATNEILMQIRRYMPETFARLGPAYRSGALYPVYGNAFHTHIAMLSDGELAGELRLNREYLRELVGAPEPRHLGAFPMEGSIDAHKLDGFHRAGMEYVIFPNLSPRKARYEFDGLAPGLDPTFGAFTIDSGLLALPRHFPISQEIWRPITKWEPERLAPQGYILGKYYVLDEEYRDRRHVDFPITRAQGVEEYKETLRSALREAPDGGLLLYIQDLELMDFGEEALDILGEAWSAVRDEAIAEVRFVTPDTYIDDVRARKEALPHMRFHQASWAPEIRLVLRTDGHYPPLHAGEYKGIDNDTDVFRRWPFIFWEPGRFIVDTFKSLVTSFGHSLDIPMSATEVDERGYDFTGLTPVERLALHLRVMQRACNFGWQPDEARHKWPYMHGLAICEILRDELREPDAAGRVAHSFGPLPERALAGLDRVLEIIVDTRLAYLRRGIANLGERAGPAEQRATAEGHLENAQRRRKRASALARQLRAENIRVVTTCPIDERAVQRVLALLQEHCKEAYLAINEIQRAWGCIDDTGGMIEEMYAYLYELFPPKFPSILRDLLSAEELAQVDDPVLA
jgi:hypothetical protein